MCPAEAQEDFYHVIFLLQCTKEFTPADMITVQNTAHIPQFHWECEQDHVHGTNYNYLEKLLCFPLFQSSFYGERGIKYFIIPALEE